MSYFSSTGVAQIYAQARPYFHPLVMSRIAARLGLSHKLSSALDVGCGTGQSSLVLTEIVDSVVGADISAEMLNEATRFTRDLPQVTYVRSTAESLPFQASSFDLITISLAFHWFERPPFYAEARRVLKRGGWLVVYNNFFLDAVESCPEFEQWHYDFNNTLYPVPPRNSSPITAEDAREAGLTLIAYEEYENEFAFTQADFVTYQMTQSSVIAAVEQGKDAQETYRDVLDSLDPFFTEKPKTFLFGGPIWYLRNGII